MMFQNYSKCPWTISVWSVVSLFTKKLSADWDRRFIGKRLSYSSCARPLRWNQMSLPFWIVVVTLLATNRTNQIAAQVLFSVTVGLLVEWKTFCLLHHLSLPHRSYSGYALIATIYEWIVPAPVNDWNTPSAPVQDTWLMLLLLVVALYSVILDTSVEDLSSAYTRGVRSLILWDTV